MILCMFFGFGQSSGSRSTRSLIYVKLSVVLVATQPAECLQGDAKKRGDVLERHLIEQVGAAFAKRFVALPGRFNRHAVAALDQHNQIVLIEEPADALPLLAMVKKVLQGLLRQAKGMQLAQRFHLKGSRPARGKCGKVGNQAACLAEPGSDLISMDVIIIVTRQAGLYKMDMPATALQFDEVATFSEYVGISQSLELFQLFRRKLSKLSKIGSNRWLSKHPYFYKKDVPHSNKVTPGFVHRRRKSIG